MRRPEVQVYDNYTDEDFKVWKTLYSRQMKALEGHVAKEYFEAIDAIGFEEEKIPDFEEVNSILDKLTGWGLMTVPNLCPVKEFFNQLSKKRFTATCWLRSYAQLDYIEEPDMFHDVFGHAPLLTNPDYCTFFKALGNLANRYMESEDVIEKLQRLYWFTIEFGLIRNEGDIKIYGAGIISSIGETENVLSDSSIKTDFNLQKIFEHEFRTDVIQPEYYVIDSFNQLKELLGGIESQF